MTAVAETGWYQSRLGEEQYLRFLPQSTLQVCFIEPLLEERNFLRRTIVEFARALATQGIGSFIPDLPGSGESRLALNDICLSDWRGAVTDAAQWLSEAGQPPHIAALRGGALIDDAAVGASWWRFAPATGIEILRPMRRASLMTGEDATLAGYAVSPRMIAEFEQASPQVVDGPLHECRAQSEGGAALWRRAEPGEDRDLVTALAEDLAQWVRSCAPR